MAAKAKPRRTTAATPIPAETESFAIDVVGASLEGVHIIEGDRLIVRKTQFARNGDLVVAQTPNEKEGYSAVRFFFRENGRIRLETANPEYEALEYEENQVRVCGVVSQIVRHRLIDYPQEGVKE